MLFLFCTGSFCLSSNKAKRTKARARQEDGNDYVNRYSDPPSELDLDQPYSGEGSASSGYMPSLEDTIVE